MRKKATVFMFIVFITFVVVVGCSNQNKIAATVGQDNISDIEFKYFFGRAEDELYLEQNNSHLDDGKIKERALLFARDYKIWLSEAREKNISMSPDEINNKLKLEMEFIGEGSPNENMTEAEINDKRSSYDKGIERWQNFNHISFEDYKKIYKDLCIAEKYMLELRNQIHFSDDELKSFIKDHPKEFPDQDNFNFNKSPAENFMKDEKLKALLNELSKEEKYKTTKNDKAYNSIVVEKHSYQ